MRPQGLIFGATTNGGRGGLALAVLVLLALPLPAKSDKPAAMADRVVDQVAIKAGPRLVGVVLGREADGTIAFAIPRAWLKKTHPQFFDEIARDEATETHAALTELVGRIADWRKARGDEKDLAFFLEREADRVEKELKAIDEGSRVEDAPFMVLDVAPSKIERVVNQPPQRRAVAVAAWREGLADVETRSMASLVQELKRNKIDPVDDPEALLELLPPRRQNEAAWAARKALVEYHFVKPLDFQGTGNVVVRAGDGLKAVDAGQMIAGVMKSLGTGSLADLVDPPSGKGAKAAANPAAERWLASAARIADSENLTGFRVTRVDQDLAARRVSVETRFVARLPDGDWKTVWQKVETTDASKPRPDIEQQIERDPQVRAALELVKSLGLGGDDEIKLAIRFGAATSQAQKEADSRFFEFRDRYLRRLDGPVLRVAPSSPAGRK
jgi:hypothetical protein